MILWERQGKSEVEEERVVGVKEKDRYRGEREKMRLREIMKRIKKKREEWNKQFYIWNMTCKKKTTDFEMKREARKKIKDKLKVKENEEQMRKRGRKCEWEIKKRIKWGG